MNDISYAPEVMKWARINRFGPKFEVLEKKIPSSAKVSVDEIKVWEEGSEYPTFSQIRELSVLYKRPLAVFFLSEPPKEDVTLPDFRTFGSVSGGDITPETRLVIRKAKKIQDYASSLYTETYHENKFKFKKYKVTDNPISIASYIRDELGIEIKKQFAYKTYEGFFEYLREKIEETGVITLKSGLSDSFPLEDCRAFSLINEEPFVILVNNKDTEGGKNFSIMHEFAHVLLRKSGICNDFGESDRNHVNPIEVFCNQFAGSFLVPYTELKTHEMINKGNKIDSYNVDNVVNKISKDFKVNRIVILRRLRDTNVITSSLYKEKSSAWESEFVSKRKSGGRFSLNTVIKKNGREYSRLVVDAYNKKKISRSEMSSYLGVKTKHLSKLQKMISKHAR